MGEYNIKKGKHYASGIHVKPVYNSKGFEVLVMFDETCLYQLEENFDQINKLYGVSNGIMPFYNKEEQKFKAAHQKNSARYGWRCTDGEKIELLAYCYVDGKRVWQTMRKVSVNRWVKIKLEIATFEYIFNSGDKEVRIFRDADASKLGYMLYPYFGGKIATPYDMQIEIEKTK